CRAAAAARRARCVTSSTPPRPTRSSPRSAATPAIATPRRRSSRSAAPISTRARWHSAYEGHLPDVPRPRAQAREQAVAVLLRAVPPDRSGPLAGRGVPDPGGAGCERRRGRVGDAGHQARVLTHSWTCATDPATALYTGMPEFAHAPGPFAAPVNELLT